MLDFITGLFVDGFLPVFLALFHHLPTVVVLLTLISLFENSRLVLGLSCTTMAIGTLDKCDSRFHNHHTTRFLTFVPCTAKFPVILFLLGIMGVSLLLVIALYLFSVCLGILFGGHHVVKCPRLKKTNLKEFIIGIVKSIFEFLKRISIGLILAVAVLYTLQYFSLLMPLANVFQPFFTPIGLTAPLIIALLFGLIAKEMIIGVLLTFGIAGLGLTMASMSSFLVFVLLYTVCLPALLAIRSKMGTGYAAKTAAFNFAIAYIAALVVYNVAVLFSM